jgi:rare lipoprotein A (peptidoglycan hydrolase)
MRLLFTVALAALSLIGVNAVPAAADDGSTRATGARYAGYGTPRPQRARATIIDDEARPRRRRAYRSSYERWERPRRARPAHVRSAKRVRKHARTHARKYTRQHQRAYTRRHHRVVRGPARLPGRNFPVQAVPATGGLVGVASYYGGRFHGRLTASGARYNQDGLTAAHRSLPFGTRVRVRHLGNGRTVEVRINDRGPFIGGRIIDLSRGAAGVLGMHGQGVARVQVTVVGR